MNDNGALRSVVWSEIFPWLSLVRSFRLAIRLRMLLLGAAAIVLMLSGWGVFGWVFSSDPAVARHLEAPEACPWLFASQLVPNRPGLPHRPVAAPSGELADRSMEPMLGSWAHLASPWTHIFRFQVGVRETAFLLLSGLWTILVWAFFGGAITRVAAVELATGERIGWGEMIVHVRAKWRAYFAAPAMSLAGVLVIAIPIALGGLLLLHWGFGVVIAGVLWPVALAGGLLMAVLLLGLMFGWPLMWATISAEGTDSFDALSRCYAYVFQRPLNYLFYVVVAAVIGFLGWLVVSNFAAGTVYLSYWAASWGGGAENVTNIITADEPGVVSGFGALLVRFWCECVKLLAVGYLYSYFWVASTAIYFLLRRDVDATEMDEVHLDEHEGEPEYGLPSLKTDEQGAPEVVEPAADDEKGEA